MRTKEFPSKPLERIAKKASKKRLSKQAAKALRTERRTLLRRDVEFITNK
jgi:histone H3/H4